MTSRHAPAVASPDRPRRRATGRTGRRGWPTSDGTAFPPEPWRLRGTALLSLFTVPTDELSSLTSSSVPTFAPVRALGRVVVAAVAARYDAGSVLRYDELLLALPHRGRRPTVSIPRIWVDSTSSAVGARELWGIPKDLGHFTGTLDGWRTGGPAGLALAVDGRAVAAVTATRAGRMWPGALTLSLTTRQRQEGSPVTARHLAVAVPYRARASWTFAPDGPLAVLARRKPFLSIGFDDLELTFGTKSGTGG